MDCALQEDARQRRGRGNIHGRRCIERPRPAAPQQRHIHQSHNFRRLKQLVGQPFDLRISSRLLPRGGNLRRPRLQFLLGFPTREPMLIAYTLRASASFLAVVGAVSEYTSTIFIPNEQKICSRLSTPNLSHSADHYGPLRTATLSFDPEGNGHITGSHVSLRI
jgi:hypothetical protein